MLEARLRDEAASNGGVLTSPLIVSAAAGFRVA